MMCQEIVKKNTRCKKQMNTTAINAFLKRNAPKKKNVTQNAKNSLQKLQDARNKCTQMQETHFSNALHKSQGLLGVSFAEYRLFYRALLQCKRDL